MGFSGHINKLREKDNSYLTDPAEQIFVKYSVKKKKKANKKIPQTNEKLNRTKGLASGSDTRVCWAVDRMCHFNLDKPKCEEGVSC